MQVPRTVRHEGCQGHQQALRRGTPRAPEDDHPAEQRAALVHGRSRGRRLSPLQRLRCQLYRDERRHLIH